jgi:membrane-bound lytic murein transglycosylase MltF
LSALNAVRTQSDFAAVMLRKGVVAALTMLLASIARAAEPVPLQDLEAAEILRLNEARTGDYPALAETRFIRAVVPYSRTLYYIDGIEQKGIAFESLRELEKSLPPVGPQKLRPKIVIIPTRRDRLFDALETGHADIAIGAFTMTEARRKSVDFSAPTVSDISDVLVTAADVEAPANLDSLGGREVHVRRSSSYHESLASLNQRLKREGKPLVKIVPVDEKLEDEDILQMVDAGILPATVCKLQIAQFWAKLYDRVRVHDNLVLRTGGQIAWALRKNTPELKKVVDAFVLKHKRGTMFGNVLLQRYLGDVDRLKTINSEAELRKFRELGALFRRHADQYDLDWLLVAAQGYQESQLDQSKRSAAGAVGIMQIKPTTAADPNVGIDDVYKADGNVHAGVKYVRFLADRYFDDPGIDAQNRMLLALAAYNAGPARVAKLRSEAAKVGLDPNQWFNNVEIIAARRIGRETVDYVGNIYKYYTVYRAIAEQAAAKRAAEEKKK